MQEVVISSDIFDKYEDLDKFEKRALREEFKEKYGRYEDYVDTLIKDGYDEEEAHYLTAFERGVAFHKMVEDYYSRRNRERDDE